MARRDRYNTAMFAPLGLVERVDRDPVDAVAAAAAAAAAALGPTALQVQAYYKLCFGKDTEREVYRGRMLDRSS